MFPGTSQNEVTHSEVFFIYCCYNDATNNTALIHVFVYVWARIKNSWR